GTSICGASAIVAADSVVQAESEESAVSLGVITLWGTVGIFVLPLLGQALSMTQFAYGVWAGASLQEMAQVVAGGAAMGDEASKVATVVKLARICLLAPVVFYLVWWMKSKHKSVGEAKVSPVPWFLVVFVVFAALNSLGPSVGLTKPVVDWLVKVDTLALSIGMAGVGLKTSVKDLKSAGWKPVVAGLAAWVFITLFSIATIKLAGI
ncbi:MAG: putative sulfate exporter family transporter, partial [Chthonomonadaceae bacterium]|nr:putative sulfate exporter family transporter [Chthonomonadaceae bacterium]